MTAVAVSPAPAAVPLSRTIPPAPEQRRRNAAAARGTGRTSEGRRNRARVRGLAVRSPAHDGVAQRVGDLQRVVRPARRSAGGLHDLFARARAAPSIAPTHASSATRKCHRVAQSLTYTHTNTQTSTITAEGSLDKLLRKPWGERKWSLPRAAPRAPGRRVLPPRTCQPSCPRIHAARKHDVAAATLRALHIMHKFKNKYKRCTCAAAARPRTVDTKWCSLYARCTSFRASRLPAESRSRSLHRARRRSLHCLARQTHALRPRRRGPDLPSKKKLAGTCATDSASRICDVTARSGPPSNVSATKPGVTQPVCRRRHSCTGAREATATCRLSFWQRPQSVLHCSASGGAVRRSGRGGGGGAHHNSSRQVCSTQTPRGRSGNGAHLVTVFETIADAVTAKPGLGTCPSPQHVIPPRL